MSLQLRLRPSLFDRSRTLTIAPEGLSYEDHSGVNSAASFYPYTELVHYRCGMKWLKLGRFTFGRVYCIDLQQANGKVLKLRCYSYLGRGKEEAFSSYCQILDALDGYHWNSVALQYLHQWQREELFCLAGVFFLPEGILIDEQKGIISWDDLGTQQFQSYYALFSLADLTHYKAFEFLHHWDTGILFTVTNAILREKGLRDSED